MAVTTMMTGHAPIDARVRPRTYRAVGDQPGQGTRVSLTVIRQQNDVDPVFPGLPKRDRRRTLPRAARAVAHDVPHLAERSVGLGTSPC